MKVLYHIMSLKNIYAERTIYNGYKHAFEDLGHTFSPFTNTDDFTKLIDIFSPDIFITSLHHHYLRYLDLDTVRKHRKRGMKVFVNMPVWKAPKEMKRINESSGVSSYPDLVQLVNGDRLGDMYFSVLEPEDERMNGFYRNTGKKYHTIPLAADKTLIKYAKYNEDFSSEIAFIGTYHPGKKKLFETYLYPLQKKYNLKLYGQDWTRVERVMGFLQKSGQYFGIPYLDSVQKPKLHIEDEARIYASSKISINLHSSYQRKYGGDCNERTFKIPLYGGFEITDDVACIHKYFKVGKEIIIAENTDDWFDKINYYKKNPEKRKSIMGAGEKKVLQEHTYHNRVEQMLKIYKELKNEK